MKDRIISELIEVFEELNCEVKSLDIRFDAPDNWGYIHFLQDNANIDTLEYLFGDISTELFAPIVKTELEGKSVLRYTIPKEYQDILLDLKALHDVVESCVEIDTIIGTMFAPIEHSCSGTCTDCSCEDLHTVEPTEYQSNLQYYNELMKIDHPSHTDGFFKFLQLMLTRQYDYWQAQTSDLVLPEESIMQDMELALVITNQICSLLEEGQVPADKTVARLMEILKEIHHWWI